MRNSDGARHPSGSGSRLRRPHGPSAYTLPFSRFQAVRRNNVTSQYSNYSRVFRSRTKIARIFTWPRSLSRSLSYSIYSTEPKAKASMTSQCLRHTVSAMNEVHVHPSDQCVFFYSCIYRYIQYTSREPQQGFPMLVVAYVQQSRGFRGSNAFPLHALPAFPRVPNSKRRRYVKCKIKSWNRNAHASLWFARHPFRYSGCSAASDC